GRPRLQCLETVAHQLIGRLPIGTAVQEWIMESAEGNGAVNPVGVQSVGLCSSGTAALTEEPLPPGLERIQKPPGPVGEIRQEAEARAQQEKRHDQSDRSENNPLQQRSQPSQLG